MPLSQRLAERIDDLQRAFPDLKRAIEDAGDAAKRRADFVFGNGEDQMSLLAGDEVSDADGPSAPPGMLSRLADRAKPAVRGGFDVTSKAVDVMSNVSRAASTNVGVLSTVAKPIAASLGVVAIAPVLPIVAPILTVAEKVNTAVKWLKTRNHVQRLQVLLTLATECGADEDLLDAIRYAIAQKERKALRNGVRSVIPGRKTFIKVAHRFKARRGVERRAHAAVLCDYVKQRDEWALRVVRELCDEDGLSEVLSATDEGALQELIIALEPDPEEALNEAEDGAPLLSSSARAAVRAEEAYEKRRGKAVQRIMDKLKSN
jgi:hypothetical protein